jgi:hypothetical protein
MRHLRSACIEYSAPLHDVVAMLEPVLDHSHDRLLRLHPLGIEGHLPSSWRADAAPALHQCFLLPEAPLPVQRVEAGAVPRSLGIMGSAKRAGSGGVSFCGSGGSCWTLPSWCCSPPPSVIAGGAASCCAQSASAFGWSRLWKPGKWSTASSRSVIQLVSAAADPECIAHRR